MMYIYEKIKLYKLYNQFDKNKNKETYHMYTYTSLESVKR